MKRSYNNRRAASAAANKSEVLVTGIPSSARRVDLFKYFNKIRVTASIKFPYEDKSESLKENKDKKFKKALIQFEHVCPAKNAIRQIEQVPFVYGASTAVTQPPAKRNKGKGKAATQDDALSTYLCATLTSELNSAAYRRALKDGTLVVRNLSFRLDEGKIKEAFEHYGEVSEVRIPRKPDGLKRGFAFVQFTTKQNATTAQRELNEKQLGDRAVRIERAVPKEVYTTLGNQSTKAIEGAQSTATNEKEANKAESRTQEVMEVEDEASDEEDEDEDDLDGKTVTKSRRIMFDNDSDDESVEEAVKPTQERESSKPARASSTQKHPKADAEANKQDLNDAADGKTLYIRNVPFDAEESAIKRVFEQFGEVAYCKLVRDRVTGLVRNGGFVRFNDRASADRVLALTDEERSESLRLADGDAGADRPPLVAMRAVTRDALRGMLQERERQRDEARHMDRRNLYLLNVRCSDERILASLSDADRARRERINAELSERLRNPLVFISTTRICLHNLPKTLDDATLRRTIYRFLRTANSSPRITECRIIQNSQRDAKTPNSGTMRSRQYAFIAFAKPEDARRAVLALDCNNSLFSNRVFAEFALENRARLRNKLARIDREREKQDSKPLPLPQQQRSNTGQPARALTKRSVVNTLNKLKQKRAKLA